MHKELTANTIKRIEAHDIVVSDSGDKIKRHVVLGERVNDDGLYLLANIIDKLTNEEYVYAITGREVKRGGH